MNSRMTKQMKEQIYRKDQNNNNNKCSCTFDVPKPLNRTNFVLDFLSEKTIAVKQQE